MKKILFLTCWSCLILQGQNKKDYSSYFEQILLIEETTAKEDFDKSISLYKDLFNRYPRVLARDAYNACQIAALRKSKSFSDFFSLCARSGIEKTILLKNYHISSEYKLDTANLKVAYTRGHAFFLTQIDTLLRAEFLNRFDLEQKNKNSSNYLQICTDNFKRIEELSKQNKFPGEDLIGPDKNLSSCVFPTLLHYPYAYTHLKTYLWQAVQSGKITPLAVLYLYSFNQTRTSSLYNEGIPKDTSNFKTCYNLPFGKESADLDEVNKQRRLKQVISVQTLNNLMNLNAKYRLDYQLGF